MAKYVRIIYLYVVAFATLCMIVTGIVGTVGSIVAYNYPSVYYYPNYNVYPAEKMVTDGVSGGATGTVTNTSTSDAKKAYEESFKEQKLRVQRTNLKSMITSLTVFVVGLPLFAFHWKLIEKERKEEEV